jgi:hypothetical protein
VRRGEEEESLGAFLEERRVHLFEEEAIAWVLACMESLSWRLGHHLV